MRSSIFLSTRAQVPAFMISRISLSVKEMLAAARQHKHRRLPMYDETPDTIVGILNTRALLLDPQIDLADAIEFPSFVPETMNLLQLFKSLQRQQRGLAIVLDEFGGTAGIVTMEDILESLIGKIRSEEESESVVMEKLGPDRWRVAGTLRLDDFRREYPPLGDVPEVETMGGLLMDLLEVVPNPGDSATFRGLKLTAQAARHHFDPGGLGFGQGRAQRTGVVAGDHDGCRFSGDGRLDGRDLGGRSVGGAAADDLLVPDSREGSLAARVGDDLVGVQSILGDEIDGLPGLECAGGVGCAGHGDQ